MTVPASPGIFGFSPQSAKGTVGTTWYRHKALRVGFGTQQAIAQFPPEVGGGFHPTGAYKSMAFGAGIATIEPRLQNVIGWLLYAVVGSLSQTFSDTPEAGIYRHRFTPPSNPLDMKWLSARRYIPGASATDEIGEVVKDGRCTSWQMTVAPGAITESTFAFVGREPMPMEDIDAGGAYEWSWGNTYETYPGVPLGHQGSLTVAGSSVKATGMQVTIADAYTNPQEEMIIGSPYPDDFIMQQQVLSSTWIYKWQNHDLYQSMATASNAADGSGYIAWSPTVYTGAFDLTVASPGYATGMANPWQLRIYAPEMTWQADAPPELIGGGWLSQRFTGIAQEQTSEPTFYVELDNLTATYAWPS